MKRLLRHKLSYCELIGVIYHLFHVLLHGFSRQIYHILSLRHLVIFPLVLAISHHREKHVFALVQIANAL